MTADVPEVVKLNADVPVLTTYDIPLPEGEYILFKTPGMLTELQWEHLLRCLEALRPGLVEKDL